MEDIRPRRQRTRQDDYLYYSLSGPPAPPPRFDQHQAYFDPGYLGLNAWMQQEDEGPNFTLANNFPRMVRWGGDDESARADEKGEQEPAPQMESAEEQGSEVEGEGEGGDRGMYAMPVLFPWTGLLSSFGFWLVCLLTRFLERFRRRRSHYGRGRAEEASTQDPAAESVGFESAAY
jgi:hypothetical protein